jgi:hypothetical protein
MRGGLFIVAAMVALLAAPTAYALLGQHGVKTNPSLRAAARRGHRRVDQLLRVGAELALPAPTTSTPSLHARANRA